MSANRWRSGVDWRPAPCSIRIMIVQGEVETVGVGSRVRVRDLDEEFDLSLVRPDEADPFAGLVSAASPLGRALHGRTAGDRVTVRAPGGVREVLVLSVGPIA
jgi:transcription elongation factor GreA